MIKTYQVLLDELTGYSNKKTKIQRMVKNKEIYPIAKGLYETDKRVNPFYLADPIYSPSYISFETALSYYDLIPERVYAVMCATFKKKKRKEFNTPFGLFMYQDVPDKAFPFSTYILNDGNYSFKIASKEKALLDKLYSTTPIANMKDMRDYLFENMRINELVLDTFNKEEVNELSKLYHSRNVELFNKMLQEDKLYD